MKKLELMIFEKGKDYCWFDEFVLWIIINENENELEYMDLNGNNHFIEGINKMEVRIS